jgi:hypothetical protein
MRTLYPSLNLIEAHLFAPSDALMRRWLENDPLLPAATRAALEADPLARSRRADGEAPPPDAEPASSAATPVPDPPRWLRERIQQRVRAQRATFSPVPTPGQIVRVDEAIGPDGPLEHDQPYPLAVLLDRPTEHRAIGYGWLVAAETDYASDADLILEEADGPRDPLAGLVQLWNPVYVYLPSTHGVLAQLPPDRLAAVRALALDFLTRPPPDLRPEPGVLIERRTSQGHRVLTGTPLGRSDDPRRRYRTLYRAAADLLREPVRLAQVQPTLAERLQARLRAAGETIGLRLILAPAPVMGEAAAEIHRLGDWLELEWRELPEETEVFALRVRNLQAATCRIQVVRQNTVYQEHVLAGHQQTRLLIEAAPGTELVLLDERGERLRWPLAA